MKYSFVIGRFQSLHAGHIKLIRTILDEGKNVCVALKDTELDENNPYSTSERIRMFEDVFLEEIIDGRVHVMIVPDIDEVCYGRKVGWGIRQIHLDPATESISGTKIRKKDKKYIRTFNGVPYLSNNGKGDRNNG